MYVHRSNRAETLLEQLANLVTHPLPDPFVPECVVVQGRGMERWLSQGLARRCGVWANPDFVFPRALLERAMAGVLGEVEDPGISYEPETLLWSVAECLPGLLREPGFGAIARYLEDDRRGERLVALSRRIAETLDHYVIYRPQMVLAWEQDAPLDASLPGRAEDERWQRRLWQALVGRHGATHLAARMRAFLSRADACELEGFPRRISLFGLSTLPPLYLDGLRALADRVEVHLFALSPSREYWADIRSERERIRALSRTGGIPEQDLHYETGHPLLASLGRLGKEFQALLEERVDYREGLAGEATDLYCDPEATSMLATLQADMLALRWRGGSGADAERLALREDDDSIRIHSCHGPMREAEVLRDQLLDLFQRHPDLEPHDVVVMTPDIEAYAPYLEAVFARGGEEGADSSLRIPSRISDRSTRSAYAAVEAFLAILDAIPSRMPVSTLLDLLAHPCVARRFGVDDDEGRQLRSWVVDVGVRWGIDAEHRRAEGQPAVVQNTWRFGLDRLLLGHASGGDALFRGVLPFGGEEGAAEGAGAQAVGKLADFCATLFALRDRALEPMTLAEWGELLMDLQTGMLAGEGDDTHQLQIIREAITELVERGARAGHGANVDLHSVRQELERSFKGRRPVAGFLSGGVTFCEMMPMRSIPFRVVCLMGMGDDSFPRIARPQGFDLISRRRMLGDRSPRDDDRTLFLEALLSARDHLIITYVGQDARSAALLPPSVVVGELLDHLADAWRLPDSTGASGGAEERAGVGRKRDAAAVRARLVVSHPLQPFSARYFDASDDARLFSYSRNDCEAALALAGERAAPAPMFEVPIDPPRADEPVDVVELDELIRFFDHPVRRFMQLQLGVQLGDDAQRLEDREPTALEGMALWSLGDRLLDAALEDRLDAALLDRVRAEGTLPLGAMGGHGLAALVQEVELIAARALQLRVGWGPGRVAVDGEIAGTRLVGGLDDICARGRVECMYQKTGYGRDLSAWIRHLVFCWLRPESVVHRSYLVGRGDRNDVASFTYRPVERPEGILADLLAIHRQGQRVPLPLFRRSSRKYAETIKAARSDDPASRASMDAYFAYRADEWSRVDADDPYVRQAFGDIDPLAVGFAAISESDDGERGRGDDPPTGFRSLALRVYGPMIDHREEMK